jgi:CRISPR-associated protein Cas2
MWLLTMFDLPVMTTKDRKDYTRFRKALLRDGFTMMQFSVYARYCGSEESSKVHRNKIKANLPPQGQIRVVTLTDHQFSKMEVYTGKKRVPTESAPMQLEFF